MNIAGLFNFTVKHDYIILFGSIIRTTKLVIAQLVRMLRLASNKPQVKTIKNKERKKKGSKSIE